MSDPDRKTYLGVDLETGTIYRSGESHDESARRVYSACIEAYEHGLPLLMLPVVTGALQAPPLKSCIEFDQKRGSISVTIFPRNSFSFTPQADGRSVLKDCVVSHAWYRGGILALAYRRSGNGTNMLGLFRAAEGTPLFEHKDFPHGAVVAISQDGRRIAFQVSKRRMKVGALDGSGGYYLVTFDVKREVRKLASV